MTETHEFKLGDRVRTSFNGEEFPGVYRITGFNDYHGLGAQLESADGDKTWALVADLHLVTEPPAGPLTPKQVKRVAAFAEFIVNTKHPATEAALTLLKSLVCIACGTRLTTKHPRCHCENDL